jgi:membrane protease YdiL (CAAX protease family)
MLNKMRRLVVNIRPYTVIFWLYFIAITCAELLTLFLNAWIGLVCHGIILIVCIVYPSFIEDSKSGNFIVGLTLIPIIRIISLIIPLIQLPEILWYPVIYIPLLAASILTMRTIGISPRQVGFTINGLPLQIMLGLFLGFMIGLLEYAILDVEPMIVHFTIGDIYLPAIILLLTTGFVEELIFRGILQSLATHAMGPTGSIIYISLIFAVLHVGFYSITDVVFVFGIALVLAMMVQSTRSLIGAIIAHGTANIILFLVAPFILTPGFQLP